MHRRFLLIAVPLMACAIAGTAHAQKHMGGTSPPTAPPVHVAPPPPPTFTPVSSGMGAMQFSPVDYAVPSPEALLRELQSEDTRTRAAAFAAIGAPAQYLVYGHIPSLHSAHLDFVSISDGSTLDALVTVELDKHLVTAVLAPEESNWRRIASVVFPTAFGDPNTSPATFLHLVRSLVQRNRYRAVFHAMEDAPNGDFTENEAHLRILNGRAVVTISFVSGLRVCDTPATNHAHQGCEITQRWLQGDPTNPGHGLTLVTATGHLTPHEAADPLARSHDFQASHLRSFFCQPYAFNETTEHYEPTGNVEPCPTSRPVPEAHTPPTASN
jgi:hypothetical protein